MIKILTIVPIVIDPIIVIARGRCNSDPRSLENRTGIIAKIVVSDVIIIGRKRLIPAMWIASERGIPVALRSFMASNLRMESFITTPHVTIMPIADIRFRLSPQIQRIIKAKAVSTGISTSTINGCRKSPN